MLYFLVWIAPPSSGWSVYWPFGRGDTSATNPVPLSLSLSLAVHVSHSLSLTGFPLVVPRSPPTLLEKAVGVLLLLSVIVVTDNLGSGA